MQADMIKFFTIQRQVFGVCPCCGEIFRLSDTQVYLKKKPVADWMDQMEASAARIEKQKEKLDSEENDLRDAATKRGRKEALKVIKRVDKILTPNKIHPDDVKVIFHPVDFVVFNGMKSQPEIKNIIFLDREAKKKEQKALQKSVEQTINKENYEWITVHVADDGKVSYK